MNTQEIPATPCYLNGAYTPLNEAKVSVMDRGFIFGDGVYEVLASYGGVLFRFEQHMARLERSLLEMRIANPHTRDEWKAIAMQLIVHYDHFTLTSALNSKNSGDSSAADHLIYFQLTRGVAMRDHVMPTGITPTVFAMCNRLPRPSAAQRASGVACVTADDFRWQKAHIKSTSLLGSVFARQISFDADALETVMFRGNYLSEASSSNVWVVKNGVVIGPPKDNLVLEGIRYGLIADMCVAKGIPIELRRISREEVLTCDELILSSATKEVLAVATLDGQKVGKTGLPGPVYHQLYAAYQTAKNQTANAATA
jgi:D-alanine transaminase